MIAERDQRVLRAPDFATLLTTGVRMRSGVVLATMLLSVATARAQFTAG